MVIVQSPAIWLIPFAQLKASARQEWTARYGDAVMPQMMTLREWAANLGVITKGSDDVHFDPAIDRLSAQRLLHSVAKSTGHMTDPEYVQRLLDATYELAASASAIAPAQRPAWIRSHAGLFDAPVFQMEAIIQFLALHWAGGSRYETDVLWQRRDQLLAAAQHIYVSPGLQQDALQTALLAGYEPKTTVIDLGARADANAPLHTEVVATNAEDLVQQAVALVQTLQQAALVNQNIAQNLALVALDRQITRRISAALNGRGIAVRDETGWALSTTTAAAQLLAWLTAMRRDAQSDDVLAAMKAAPLAFDAKQVEDLETQIRANGWVIFPVRLHAGIQQWQASWAAPRSVIAWLHETRALLQSAQLLAAFEADAAGQALLTALHIANDQALNRLSAIDGANAKMPLQAFIQWVRAVLEASRFRPMPDTTAAANPLSDSLLTVTILPLPQLWGRSFDAVILPGCDIRRLPARPMLTGDWRAAEREALNLLTAETALAAHQKAWDWVCAQPHVTMLRHTSEGSESLQQSVLLQRLQVAGLLEQRTLVNFEPFGLSLSKPQDTDEILRQAQDEWNKAQDERHIAQDERPMCQAGVDVFKDGVVIDWQQLAPAKLSASSYADLRACPYSFYATRILGLSASDELDGTVDKRDFGTWLHGTLHRFHEELKRSPTDDKDELAARLDRAAAAEQSALELDAAAFLPFSLIWPQTREAYLAWLAEHCANGYTYAQGEVWKSFALELAGKSVELVGQIDRIDTQDAAKHAVQGAGLLLMDYKTESASKTKQRISQADEDTQLAFYAALIHHDGHNDDHNDSDIPVQAAYVNLAERLRDVKTSKDGASEQMKLLPDLEARRDALLDGIWSDLSNIADGQGLRALGEGAACEHCAARGLCRRDFQ